MAYMYFPPRLVKLDMDADNMAEALQWATEDYIRDGGVVIDTYDDKTNAMVGANVVSKSIGVHSVRFG